MEVGLGDGWERVTQVKWKGSPLEKGRKTFPDITTLKVQPEWPGKEVKVGDVKVEVREGERGKKGSPGKGERATSEKMTPGLMLRE